MSHKAAARILSFSVPTLACPSLHLDGSTEMADVSGKPLGTAREATRAKAIVYDNGCSMRMLASMFDPTVKIPGIAILGYCPPSQDRAVARQ